MTAITTARMAQAAYGVHSAAARTERGTEYAVFMRITRQMQAAAGRGSRGFPELAASLHENRKLWSILVADLADPGNALPRELKARLLSLAEFTFRHGDRVLAREADVRPLIEINAAIMRGLAGEGASA